MILLRLEAPCAVNNVGSLAAKFRFAGRISVSYEIGWRRSRVALAIGKRAASKAIRDSFALPSPKFRRSGRVAVSTDRKPISNGQLSGRQGCVLSDNVFGEAH